MRPIQLFSKAIFFGPNMEWSHTHTHPFNVGIVELCAKILQIMRNDFKDYARTFCQLCAPFSVLYYT